MGTTITAIGLLLGAIGTAGTIISVFFTNRTAERRLSMDEYVAINTAQREYIRNLEDQLERCLNRERGADR